MYMIGDMTGLLMILLGYIIYQPVLLGYEWNTG